MGRNKELMDSRPDLLAKAKELGYYVGQSAYYKNTPALFDKEGKEVWRDSNEEGCWVRAMRHADIYINLVENRR